ncbi:hypothetical protein [Aquimarina sp. SS2-1]|uniref:hypothetical protein n=1 Tax=Aquimarina besae TaxID=3342247 RepID=UPI00366FB52B
MEKQKRGFKLSKVNWIFALIVIGISSLIFLRRDGINGFSLGYLFGSIATSAIIPLFFALMVWLIKGKKEYSGTYTFNIILTLMCFGMIKEIGSMSKEQSESVDSITKSVEEYKERINNEEDGLTAYREHISNVDNGISKMIKNSTGNEQEVYINLQKFSNLNSSVMINWQKAYDSVLAPRILDYSVLNNQEEFEYQIGVLKYYRKQSESYKSHFENRKSLIIDLNKNIPENNQTLIGVMRGINKKDSIQKPVFKPFINSHISYGNNLIKIVEFLNLNSGKWEYENEELIFENSELETKYSELINKITENENQVNRWTDELIKVM